MTEAHADDLRDEHLSRELLETLKRPGAEGELLHYALRNERPPYTRRVFTNRTLRMEKIRSIGFDLDWTLADYHGGAMAQLAFKLSLERLVEQLDYPESILRASFRVDFCRRGLMLDMAKGTVLKMNRHRYVGRAYHGRHFLDPQERSELYRREPINPSSPRFRFADTLFELPEFNIFSEIVELERSGESFPHASWEELFRNVRESIDQIHRDGTLKKEILADLPRYLPIDPQLVIALRRLALGDRKLLLITNSEPYYTDAICSYLFSPALSGKAHWRELFDLVITSSRKPNFFRKKVPFVPVDAEGREGEPVEVPEWGGFYSGGCREGLMKLLDHPGENFLYVGDHIYGDILTSKMASTWRTALIVKELEDELAIRRSYSAQGRHLDVLRAELAELGHRIDDLQDVLDLATHGGNGDAATRDTIRSAIRTLQSEHRVMRHHARRLQSRISRALNPYWGSLFKQGSSKSLFGAQVDDFACLYTSRVSNFADYGTNHYFRVLGDPMMHEIQV